MAPERYDIQIHLKEGKNLPIGDFTSSDPYVEITTKSVNLRKYKSFVQFKTLNPVWDEMVLYAGMPDNTTLQFCVKDKDFGISRDDTLGRFDLTVSATDFDLGKSKECVRDVGKNGGKLYLQVTVKPSAYEEPTLVGPVRCRVHFSPFSGLVTGASKDGKGFPTYKLFLHSVAETFGSKQHWNESYPAAQSIFRNPVLQATIAAQHASLYSTNPCNTTKVIRNSNEFFKLLDYGHRDNEMRYYTYVIMEDSMRFSETGTAFFNDMLSKHALHATAAPEVYYAGEFCIMEQEDHPGHYTLIIDNNSGTYAPKGEVLTKLRQLFELNFPDMCVEVVDSQTQPERLKELHQRCPSRRKQEGGAQ